MKLHLTPKNILDFFVFAMLMGEAHEISHFLVGKIVCGCWPASRDFNAWSLCEGCPLDHWATITGPLFSMTLAWTGMFLLRSSDAGRQSIGFALIWANVPQARIMTVLMGGGDEKVFWRAITQGTFAEEHFRVIAIVFVLIIALPPIIASFRTVQNRLGWLYNIGFMIVPLLVLGLYGFVFLNGLLEGGFLADVWIMGTPLFITAHTVLMLVLLLAFLRRSLFTLVKDNGRALKHT
jgi:hypothetical protein